MSWSLMGVDKSENSVKNLAVIQLNIFFLLISGIVLYKEFYGLTFLEIFMFLFG